MAKNLFITGTNGFIGTKFIDLYADKFDKVICLDRKNKRNTRLQHIFWDMENSETLQKIDVDCDTFIHLAYDSINLKNNIKAVQNILSFCQERKVNRFIHISTVSVYQPNLSGKINEELPYSTLSDPYSSIKIKQEKLISLAGKTNQSTNFVILQPAIVYGFWGNWSIHAIEALAKGVLKLPQGGMYNCNFVYVDDVCKAIYLSCTASLQNEQRVNHFLISSGEHITWKEFYQLHFSAYKNKFSQKIKFELSYKRLYHRSFLRNFIYHCIFSKIGFTLLYHLSFLIKFIKKKKNIEYDIDKIIETNRHIPHFTPFGINTLVHSCNFNINISKAKKDLNFEPDYLSSNIPDTLKTKYSKTILKKEK